MQSVDKTIAGGSFLTTDVEPNDVFIPEEFTDEQKMIAKTTEEFVIREVLSLGEEGKKLNYDLILQVVKKAGEVGILGASLPEEYGGFGLDGVRFALMKEKLNVGSSSLTMTIGGQVGIGMLPIVFFGSEMQKKKYLPILQSGEITTAFALTEPQSGTDASSIKTTAKLSEDKKHYVLNGSKVFITNAGFSDIFVVFAKVDGTKFSAFIVDRNLEGVSVGPEEKKMGLKASSTTSISFEDVKVPAENLLGNVGEGHLIAFCVLNFGRLSVGAGCLGNIKETIETTVEYANQRVQFGQKISSFPLIGKKIAEMNIKSYVLESMVYRTAKLFDEQIVDLDFSDPNIGEKAIKATGEYMLECGINKVFGSEALDFAADEGLQIHGGYGYIQEYIIEGIYRDSRIKRIFEGSNEIVRMFVTNTITRRLAKGKSPELQQMMKDVHSEFAKYSPDLNFNGLLAQETYLVGLTKKIYAFILDQVIEKYGNEIEKEQEVSSDLADIVINMYAMESALLRTKKLVDLHGEDKAKLPLDMTISFIHDAFNKVIGFSNEVLCTIKSGEELSQQLAILNKVATKVPANTNQLKRNIAKKITEVQKYSVL